VGIDTQKNGFFFLALAWTTNMTKYIIDYGTLANFEEVRQLIHERSWPVQGAQEAGADEDEARLDVWRAAIDSGGTAMEGAYSRTEEVYEFVWRFGEGRLHAIKGANVEQGLAVRMSHINKMPGRKTPMAGGGIGLYTLDTGKIKSSLFHCLTGEGASRPIKIFGYDPERESQEGLHDILVRHLTAERQVRNTSGKLVWVQERKDNHYLDCLMMAMACGDVSWTPGLKVIIEMLQNEREEQARIAYRPPIKSTTFKKKKFRRGW
jgi:phage terminase large subunit GpA-like protein